MVRNAQKLCEKFDIIDAPWYNLGMADFSFSPNTREQMARILHEAIVSCVASRFATRHGSRSGKTTNKLHTGFAQAYFAGMQDIAKQTQGHEVWKPVWAGLHVKSEETGKISIPYGDRTKNADLALMRQEGNADIPVQAFFIKLPLTNYNKNSTNYQENMHGTHALLYKYNPHLRTVFLDILPKQNLVVDQKGHIRRYEQTNAPSNLAMKNPSTDAVYAKAFFDYHPELLVCSDRKAFGQKWKQLTDPILNLDVNPLIDALETLVNELPCLMTPLDVPAVHITADQRQMLKRFAHAPDNSRESHVLATLLWGERCMSLLMRNYLEKESALAWADLPEEQRKQRWKALDAHREFIVGLA